MIACLDFKFLFALFFLFLAGTYALFGAGASAGGIHEEVLQLKKGGTLRYTLSIPPSYKGEKEVPLVLALHYGGPVTPYYGKGVLQALVEPGLRELEAIMVAPDCPGKGWGDPVSVSRVMELVDFIKNNYKIDPNRVVVTGFSLGGIGTWYLAARYPEIFSAAIPIASRSDKETILKIAQTGMPLYVIHSRADRVLPIDSVERTVTYLKSKGKSVHFEVLEGIDHYDTSRFTPALKATVPWIKKVWSAREGK